MRTLACLAVAALSVAARPQPAEACSCLGPTIQVSPDGKAPINTTVLAMVPQHRRLTGVTLSLRHKASGKPIAVSYRTNGSADVRYVELRPRKSLAPNTAYEVVAAKDMAEHVVGTFTTTAARAAAKRPAWRGVARAAFYKGVAVCCDCSTNDHYIEVELRDRLPSARYAIWVAGRDGKIDYARPPVTYAWGGTKLYLGHPSSCGMDNFTIPRRKALRLGFKLVDLAGHASRASEVVLDTTKPLRPSTP